MFSVSIDIDHARQKEWFMKTDDVRMIVIGFGCIDYREFRVIQLTLCNICLSLLLLKKLPYYKTLVSRQINQSITLNI